MAALKKPTSSGTVPPCWAACLACNTRLRSNGMPAGPRATTWHHKRDPAQAKRHTGGPLETCLKGLAGVNMLHVSCDVRAQKQVHNAQNIPAQTECKSG